MTARPRFGTVVLDVDSTVAGIEGIDWLAARKGRAVADRISALTAAAMDGSVPLDAVYAERMTAVAPSRSDIDALADAYRGGVAPGAKACIDALGEAGVLVILISGGLRQALLPLARELGLHENHLHAVGVKFASDGSYAGFDAESPLTTSDGKARIIATLRETLLPPILHVGDGVTDADARPAVDAFAAYTGFVHRARVVERADFVVDSFDALCTLVLPGGSD